MSQSPLDVAGFGRVVLSVMPTIRQATWRESVAGGSLQPITGFTSECDYCAERVFEADEVRCMSLTLDHRIFCPDAPPIELPHQGGQHMSHQDTERLSDALVAEYLNPTFGYGHSDPQLYALAREVQASRKLVADLRAEHACLPDELPSQSWCKQDGFSWPCPTIRMIDEAGL